MNACPLFPCAASLARALTIITIAIVLTVALPSRVLAQTNADGSINVPIYVTNASNYSPSHYTIYAGIGGGPLLPYLFDTGAPNFFSVYGTDSNTTATNGSFTFAQAPTYYYQTLTNQISLGSSNNVTNVTTGSAGYAQVRYIQNGTNGDINQQYGNILTNDGTYGDFGAGLYGNSALATVLTQIPLAGSLKVGYSLNLGTGEEGTLTLGLSAALLAQLTNAPGAVIMSLSPSGTNLPTPDGGSVAGYDKAQVSNVALTLTATNGDSTTTNTPFVIDTGGGPNAVVYAMGLDQYSYATGLRVASTNGETLYSLTNGITPWGGHVSIISDTNGGDRLNSGGYFFQSNIVTFDLADGIVIIDPVPEPTSSWLLLLGGGLVLACLGRAKGGKGRRGKGLRCAAAVDRHGGILDHSPRVVLG